MNYLKYVYNGITKPFTTPNNWNDVPFYKFVEYKKLIENGDAEDQTKIYSLFTKGLDKKDWEKPHNPKLYESLNNQLNFLSEEPNCSLSTHIYRGVTKKKYKVYDSIDKCTAAEYWSMLEVTKNILANKSTETDILEVMPKLIAVLCCKEINEEEVNKIAKELEQMPTDKIYVLGCFFLQKLNGLRSGIGVIHRIKNRIMHTFKQVMAILLVILVITLRCITLRKGAFQSLKSFLIQTWLKFTFRYSSWLILPVVKTNTEI